MSAQHQLNPTDLSNEQLDRLAFAIAARINAGMELLTIQEAADYLKIEYKTLLRRKSQGRYPKNLFHKMGGRTLTIKAELCAYVKSL